MVIARNQPDYEDMKWKPAPIIKVYEALGSLADGRVGLDGHSAKVHSSSGNKYYDVAYDPAENAIASNDNDSFWQGYLGYPSIAVLLALGKIDYGPRLPEFLKGFAWEDLNQQFKNDFIKTQNFIDTAVAKKHSIGTAQFHALLESVQIQVNALGLNKLASTKRPPKAY